MVAFQYLESGELLVAVDGACRSNGTPYARSSIGVYFGFGSPHNIPLPVGGPPPYTNQKAELIAAKYALLKIRDVMYDLPQVVDRVVIRTDSEYLVKGMTEWINMWRVNGYQDIWGQSVTNAEYFQQIDSLTYELIQHHLEVEWRHVPREMNQEADRLANQALDNQY
jgi:ribonuclease HI